MKFSRKQELKLIDIGLSTLVSKALSPVVERAAPKPKKIRGWSTARRAKFMKTVKAKWDKKRNGKA